MESFVIEITETLSKLIEVQAEDLDEAIEIAKEKYNNEEIELGEDDELEVTFNKYRG